MSERVLTRIQVRMKTMDNVFHTMIIALERLELFLEIERRGTDAIGLQATGIHTSRDLHDDVENPPNRELLLGEVLLDCQALYSQTKFDDEDLFKQTMQYFMSDLLEWYGGRGNNVPYDEVEKYVLPIIVALSRQVEVKDYEKDVKGEKMTPQKKITQISYEYVAKLRDIDEYSPDEKEEAVIQGFTEFLKAQHEVAKQMQAFIASGEEVVFTEHKRGTVTDGYNRLMDAMLNLYDSTIPAKMVRNTFTKYVKGLPEFTDEMIAKAIQSRETVTSKETTTEQDAFLNENSPADTEVKDSQQNVEETQTEKEQE